MHTAAILRPSTNHILCSWYGELGTPVLVYTRQFPIIPQQLSYYV